MKIKSFEELEVWQKAHELTLPMSKLTQNFPKEERFGLVSQLRRAASSIAANIVEGYGRRTTKELLRSLRIANGEAEEVRYFSILSRDLGYFGQEEFNQINQLCRSISQLLSALGRSLKLKLRETRSHTAQEQGSRSEPKSTITKRPGRKEGERKFEKYGREAMVQMAQKP